MPFCGILRKKIMKGDFALQEITRKLDEIKEVWQIYEIFEKAKKEFNKMFKECEKY